MEVRGASLKNVEPLHRPLHLKEKVSRVLMPLRTFKMTAPRHLSNVQILKYFDILNFNLQCQNGDSWTAALSLEGDCSTSDIDYLQLFD